MHGETLFIIPIYYKSLDSHFEAQNNKKKKFVAKNMAMRYHLTKEEYEITFDRQLLIPWQYSQIVGYVEINISNFGDLKAYYWFVKAKRLSDNLKNRTMDYAGKLFDVSKLNKPNDVIRKDIRDFIVLLPSLRKKFKKRYFYVQPLEKILDSIDFSDIRV